MYTRAPNEIIRLCKGIQIRNIALYEYCFYIGIYNYYDKYRHRLNSIFFLKKNI